MAIRQMREWGITSIQETETPIPILPIYQEMLREGDFPIRNSFIVGGSRLDRSLGKERYKMIKRRSEHGATEWF